MNIIINWVIAALALGVAAYLTPGVTVTLGGAFITAVVLGLLTAFVKPLLVVLTLPVNILTLGLFTIVINAALVLLASMFVPGFKVEGWIAAIIFSIVLALVNVLFFNIWK